MKKEYVLRAVDNEEISRLEFQHQVWQKESHLAIQKAGINPGDKVLDLGSGPGYLTFELAELVGEKGKVYALDNSEKFTQFIRKQQLENVEVVQTDIRKGLGDVAKIEAPDKVFCRWVLMFTGNLDKVIDSVYKLLKPGGRFISIEYFRFYQIDMFPKSEPFDQIYAGVQKLLRNNGGDPNAGDKVYEVMQSVGFKQVETYPIYRTGHPGSELWEWLERTNKNHVNLVQNNLINEATLQNYYQDWAEKAKAKTSFITAPPLMITIGEK